MSAVTLALTYLLGVAAIFVGMGTAFFRATVEDRSHRWALLLPLAWILPVIVAELFRVPNSPESKTASWVADLIAPALFIQALASGVIVVWVRRPVWWITVWLILNFVCAVMSAFNLAMFASGDWI
ncbi:hypothetical protein [Phenylobacterium aquaticum]|uniref:hypothetical protein n=2 Tax=Phenylobacterium aquaticum TaxID=1763816 RepID=UPI0026ED0698|nr:hypothetical protein [Phenylobacterium aquaticum]